MIKILFVCLGNICRSPMAEAIFNQKLRNHQLEKHFEVDSAGIGPWHIGSPPDPRTIDIVQKNNIPINHIGRQFSPGDSNYDYIIVMDDHNLQTILQLTGSRHKGLFLMGHFDPENPNAEVPDPYHGDEQDFEKVFHMLDRCNDHLIQYLLEKHHL